MATNVININGKNYDAEIIAKMLNKINESEQKKEQNKKEREENKEHKTTLREFFASYADTLCGLWYAFKKSDTNTSNLIINNLAGLAGGANMKIYEYIIAKYTKRVDKDGNPLSKAKDGKYKHTLLNAHTAITLLKNACLNYIETLRKGNKWGQIVISDNDII